MSDEIDRTREVRRHAILETPPEPRLDRITALAARIFGAPIALITVVEGQRQWFKSRYGLDIQEMDCDSSFCVYTIQGKEVMVVPDASRDSRFAANALVTGGPGVRFYAGAPLITGGCCLGTLCIMDTAARQGFSAAQAATLTDLAAIVVDELEFRLAERERQDAGKLFASVFDTVPVGLAIVDEDGLYVHVNSAYCRLYGYEPDELLGRGFWLVLPEAAREEIMRAHRAFIAGGEPLPHTHRVITKDGRPLDVYIDYSLLVTAGGRRLRVTAVTDVTSVRQAEAALRDSNHRLSQLAAIIESADDAILGTTLDDVITSWNPGCERLYGYTAAEIVGRSLEVIVPVEMLEERRAVRRRIEAGERVTYETIRLRKSGERIDVSLACSPVLDAGGAVIGSSVVARDITGRKLLEQQLIQSQKMEAVALLAGGVAHDFNNLLTIIIGYGRMLLVEAAEHPEWREYAQEILYSAERASSLTSQLLAFSRRQIAKPRVLDLNEILERMHKLLARLLGEHIVLRTLPGANLGRVKADPGQIEQVIANLAVNARDAMARGGTLSIETANVELNQEYVRKHPQMRSGPYVMLAVSDTGVGMPPAIVQHIFEPFFTTKPKGKGTGLGLSIIHGIVKQSGGEIWVYSEPGRGTTFKIYLPRVWETADAWRPSHAGSVMPAGTETVLVVEDEAAVQKMVREILTRLGYKVLDAPDGKAALDLCSSYKEPIAVMLTDVVMPGMAGPDLARAVRLLRPETAVLFMSGYTENSIFQQEMIDPDADFLQKPFTPDELAQRIRELLDRNR